MFLVNGNKEIMAWTTNLNLKTSGGSLPKINDNNVLIFTQDDWNNIIFDG